MKIDRVKLATWLLAGCGVVVIPLWQWRMACHNSGIYFLPHRQPAEWIVYPSPPAPSSRGDLIFRAKPGSVFGMPLSLEQVAQEAMQLPVAERALLADRLVESLDFSDPDEIQRIWAGEAIRRREEIRCGQVKPIPGDEVLAEVRLLVGR